MLRKIVGVILLAAAALTLAACSAGGNARDWDEHTLVYANLSRDGPDREAIDDFNLAHTDVQIEVRDYIDAEGNVDKSRLLAEIVAGKGPDIIDMGHAVDAFTTLLPYQRLARAGYLEGLWPYIENDPELGREALLEPPLKAAEVDGGLYIAFPSVRINTLAGAESVVGDRTSWTLEELREVFASMPADSTVLSNGYTRRDAFAYISCMSLDSYVDWETGQCSFDCEGFRSLVEFAAGFPEESSSDSMDPTDFDAMMAMEKERVERLYGGRQMLQAPMIGRLQDVQFLDSQFGGKAAFVGYPVEDGSVGSSFFITGRILAMSSTCRNKEAAWDFLRQTFLPKGRRERSGPIPVNRSDYELSKKCDIGLVISNGPGPEYTMRAATAEETQRYEDLLNSIDKIELCDKTVFDIVQESLDAYFAGDKTLDEVIALIQNRVTLYVNENR